MHSPPKALILDFGQVLIDLDMERAKRSFASLGIPDIEERFSLLKADPMFVEFELGQLEPAGFFEGIRSMSASDPTDEEIASAWNALLADYRLESLRFVESLKGRMPVYLYSNTNRIHYDFFQRRLRETTPYARLEDLFVRAYFSHDMGMRKPGPEGYLTILEENGLEPSTTLFVDDHPDNIQGADAVGLRTHRLLPDERLERVLAFLSGTGPSSVI